MSSIKILFLNIRGLCNKFKREKAFLWLQEQKVHIIFLQETHSTPADEQAWRNEWGNDIFFSHGKSNSSGTAVSLSKNGSHNIKTIVKDDKGYFVIMILEQNSKTNVIINTYSPISEYDQQIIIKSGLITNCRVIAVTNVRNRQCVALSN